MKFTADDKEVNSKIFKLGLECESYLTEMWILEPLNTVYSHKEIKKKPPECTVELYKHAGIFKNTREVQREARGTT